MSIQLLTAAPQGSPHRQGPCPAVDPEHLARNHSPYDPSIPGSTMKCGVSEAGLAPDTGDGRRGPALPRKHQVPRRRSVHLQRIFFNETGCRGMYSARFSCACGPAAWLTRKWALRRIDRPVYIGNGQRPMMLPCPWRFETRSTVSISSGTISATRFGSMFAAEFLTSHLSMTSSRTYSSRSIPISTTLPEIPTSQVGSTRSLETRS